MKKVIFGSAVLLASGLIFTAFNEPTKTEPVLEIPQIAGKWVIDKSHSNIRFTVKHMVVSECEGSFKNFDGTFEATKADFSDAKITFTIDVNSINTNNERRDGHLKGEDFFAADKFPQIKFESTSFTPKGDNKYELKGNLTVRDVTKPITFDVKYGGSIKTQRGNKAGFKATGSIDRFDYGLKWSRMTEAGGLAVSKEVDITVNIEMDETNQ